MPPPMRTMSTPPLNHTDGRQCSGLSRPLAIAARPCGGGPSRAGSADRKDFRSRSPAPPAARLTAPSSWRSICRRSRRVSPQRRASSHKARGMTTDPRPALRRSLRRQQPGTDSPGPRPRWVRDRRHGVRSRRPSEWIVDDQVGEQRRPPLQHSARTQKSRRGHGLLIIAKTRPVQAE
jgi:hypothetical protein